MKLREKLIFFLKGISMGLADIIPGVSGGTIALITGIYERLIFAIKSIDLKILLYLVKLDFEQARESLNEVDFELLIPLSLGVGIAFLAASHVILIALNKFPAFTYAFFFGLILASALLIYRRIGRLNWKVVVVGLLGVVFALWITGQGQGHLKTFSGEDATKITEALGNDKMPTVLEESLGKDWKNDVKIQGGRKGKWEIRKNKKMYRIYEVGNKLEVYGQRSLGLGHGIPIIFLSGFIAICAMILPGISGSFMLLLIGQYKYMLNALKNFTIEYPTLLIFLAGATISILSFSRVLSYFLEKHESCTLGFLTGLMLGALRKPVSEIIFAVEVGGSLPFASKAVNLLVITFFGFLGILAVYLLEGNFIKGFRTSTDKI